MRKGSGSAQLSNLCVMFVFMTVNAPKSIKQFNDKTDKNPPERVNRFCRKTTGIGNGSDYVEEERSKLNLSERLLSH